MNLSDQKQKRTGEAAANVWLKTVVDWRQRVNTGQTFGSCCSACLIGMPWLLAVVAEVYSAAWTFTVQLGTAGTATGYHCIPYK